MNVEEIKSVKKYLVGLSVYYNKQLDPMSLEMMAEDLQALTFTEFQEAIKKYRMNPKNTQFPLPAALVAIIKPQENDLDVARTIANKIWDGIGKFGYTGAERAKEALGELGWEVVQQMGGWVSICQCASGDQRGIFVAQARELADSIMRLSKAGKLNHKFELPKPYDSEGQKRVESLVGNVFAKNTTALDQ